MTETEALILLNQSMIQAALATIVAPAMRGLLLEQAERTDRFVDKRYQADSPLHPPRNVV